MLLCFMSMQFDMSTSI